jgi:DNA/RNA-binding domain of Phe-tRNA-synthetase-like protein
MSAPEPPRLEIEPHPALIIAAFTTVFPAPLGELQTDPVVAALLRADATALPPGVARDEPLRQAVRDALRHGGYRPTGRGKPAAEYLIRAAAGEALHSINAAVDACNAVSLHSGLPISLIDLAAAAAPFRVAVAPPGAAYIFNASGQVIELGGLVCLFDAVGPCANAVRDAQRTKTGPDTVRTLSVLWAPAGFEARLQAAERWYRALLARSGAVTAGCL